MCRLEECAVPMIALVFSNDMTSNTSMAHVEYALHHLPRCPGGVSSPAFHIVLVSLNCMRFDHVDRQKRLIRFIARKEISRSLNGGKKIYVYKIAPRISFGIRRESENVKALHENLSVCEERDETLDSGITPNRNHQARVDSDENLVGMHPDGPREPRVASKPRKISLFSIGSQGIEGIEGILRLASSTSKAEQEEVGLAEDQDGVEAQLTLTEESSPTLVAEEGIDVVVEGGMDADADSDKNSKAVDHDTPAELTQAYLRFEAALSSVTSASYRSTSHISDVRF